MTSVSGWRALVLPAVALVAACLAFAGSLSGEFVYDDEGQIVRNHLIKDPSLIGEALLTDVWSFDRSTGSSASNYWRPTFIAWLMLNYQLFGVDDPFGWHLTNLLLHVSIVGLAYLVLRQLRFDPLVAGAIVLIYAVHPVHVETVAWISASPNMLLLLPLLGSLALIAANRERRSPLLWVLALLLFAMAQLAKEMAILFPAIVAATLYWTSKRGKAEAVRGALIGAAPFGVVVVLFLIARYFVLGEMQMELAGRPGYASLLLTAPSILVFYLRQTLFPAWIGPTYPLRVVDPAAIGLTDFWLPLVVLGLASLATWRLVRNEPLRQLGLLLFVLPLLPALNINAFLPEELVHDRYLHLPLLGALMVLVPAATAGLSRAFGTRRSAARRTAYGIAVVCSLLLGVRTATAVPDWHDNLSLWSASVEADPGSSSAWAAYGTELHKVGRLDEAKDAMDRAVAIRPLTNAYMGRADVALLQHRYQDAERDLLRILSDHDDYFRAYERLAIVYQGQRRLSDAEQTLRTARQKLPYRRAELTAMLATVLYQAGRRDDALSELEAALRYVPDEGRVGAKDVHLRLGLLYAEQGRVAEAAAALGDFLDATERYTDPQLSQRRELARRTLDGLDQPVR